MKSALMAVAIAALMGGLVVAPVTQQSAQAQVYGGLKALDSTGGTPTSGTTNDRGEVILVGRGGGGGHGGGGHGGGGHGGGGGGKASGGHGGGKAFSGGGHGGGKAYRGGSRGGSYAYRGGKSQHHGGKGHKGKNYSHNNKHYYNRYYRYRNYGWYGGAYAYGYGNCAWLRQQALITGSQYWWSRYYDCIY